MTPRRPIVAGVRSGPHSAEPQPGPQPDELREAFSRWASGVAVVAARDEGSIVATTATAFTPVSLDPPLLLVCLGANATVLPLLRTGDRFTVSILAEGQRRLSSVFADPAPLGRAHFRPDGDPVVEGAVCALACAVDEWHAAGDHVIVIGRVQGVLALEDGAPLVYFRREYRRLE